MLGKKTNNSTSWVGRSIILTLALTIMMGLAGCQRSSSNYSDQQIIEIMQQPENLPYNYWHGESKWELKEKGSHMLSFGHLEFGRIFTEDTDWGVILREIFMKKSQRLNKNPLLLTPLLDSKDPDVILYALHCYEQRADAFEQHSFDDVRPLHHKLGILINEYPDTRVRWKAFRLMTELNWVSITDLTRALDDPAESIRLAAANQLGDFHSILEFEKEVGLRQDYSMERDIRNSLIRLAIKHINDNHYNVRFCCSQALKSSIQKPGLRTVIIDNKSPDEFIDIDWMRESWWKRHTTQKQLLKWAQQNGIAITAKNL